MSMACKRLAEILLKWFPLVFEYCSVVLFGIAKEHGRVKRVQVFEIESKWRDFKEGFCSFACQSIAHCRVLQKHFIHFQRGFKHTLFQITGLYYT